MNKHRRIHTIHALSMHNNKNINKSQININYQSFVLDTTLCFINISLYPSTSLLRDCDGNDDQAHNRMM